MQDKIDRYTFNVYANVSIVGSSYIVQPDSDRPDETTVSSLLRKIIIIHAITGPSACCHHDFNAWRRKC